jgi:thiamine biosynthesis lipoprotein
MESKRKSTRREFLKGEAAVEAFADMTHGTVPEPASAKKAGISQSTGPNSQSAAAAGQPQETVEPTATYLIDFSRQAMACQFAIYLNAGQYTHGPEHAFEALDLIEQLEDQMTVYRDHSEISQINQTAATYPAIVESQLYGLLRESFRLYGETNGAFDITSGPLSKAWGFFRRQGQIPDEESIAAALDIVGSQWLELDDEHHMVSFKKSGIEINLGGIGKGYALDRGAELLQENGTSDFVFHGGQSSIVARGSRLDPEQETPGWKVGVNHPLRPEQRLAEITLQDQAIGTSGSRRQSFYHQGKRYGHIIDPRTGWPAQDVYSATVIAPTAATADALSTAFYVMGIEKSLSYCEHHPEVAALIVTPSGRSGSIEIHSIGLDNSTCQLITDK